VVEFLVLQIKLGRVTLDAIKAKFGENSNIYISVADSINQMGG
jgi:hypothetical protein